MPSFPTDTPYGQLLGWSVGLPSWLDDPDSKVNRYWRLIEEGSSANVGRKLVGGLWGPARSGGSWGAGVQGFERGAGGAQFYPFYVKEGTDPLRAARAALWTLMEGGHGSKMELLHANPRGKQTAEQARRRLFGWLMTRARFDQIPFVTGEIRNKIEAQHFYTRAAAQFAPLNKTVELLIANRVFANILRDAKGQVHSLDSPKGLQVARGYAAFDNPAGRISKGHTRSYGSASAPDTGAMATVTASARVQSLSRTGGHFSVYQIEVRRVNAQVAAAFQEHVVQLMRTDRLRPPTGRLIEATAHPRNRFPSETE